MKDIYSIEERTEISWNSIDVKTLGKIISVKPGEPKCKPADFTSRPIRFVIVLYGIATKQTSNTIP